VTNTKIEQPKTHALPDSSPKSVPPDTSERGSTNSTPEKIKSPFEYALEIMHDANDALVYTKLCALKKDAGTVLKERLRQWCCRKDVKAIKGSIVRLGKAGLISYDFKGSGRRMTYKILGKTYKVSKMETNNKESPKCGVEDTVVSKMEDVVSKEVIPQNGKEWDTTLNGAGVVVNPKVYIKEPIGQKNLKTEQSAGRPDIIDKVMPPNGAAYQKVLQQAWIEAGQSAGAEPSHLKAQLTRGTITSLKKLHEQYSNDQIIDMIKHFWSPTFSYKRNECRVSMFGWFYTLREELLRQLITINKPTGFPFDQIDEQLYLNNQDRIKELEIIKLNYSNSDEDLQIEVINKLIKQWR